MNEGERHVSDRLTTSLYRNDSAAARRSQFVAANSHHWSGGGKDKSFYEKEALKRFPD